MDQVEPDSVQYAPSGSICKIHNLYRTKPDESGHTCWTKEIPNELVEPAENPESGQYALIVRNAKCYDGRKTFDTESIVVQSAPLKNFLAKVMKGYAGLTMTLARVEFSKPFKPFVHRWAEFTKARDEESDSTTKAHVDLLYEVLEEELHDTITEKNDLISNGVVTFNMLWTIFQPGDVLFSVLHGRQRGFLHSTGHIDSLTGDFEVQAKYIDFDGDNFGSNIHHFSVPSYEGTSPITALPVFPLMYHANREGVREELIARGKLWEKYRSYHYKQYDGNARGYFYGRELKFNISSRIVIDAEAYNLFNPDGPLFVSSKISGRLSDEQHLVTTPIIRGYALKDKKWLEFYLEGVKDIVWNLHAFDSLVFPPAQQDLKQLILAFTKAQSNHIDGFDDFIQGKGRGVITLLSGPPGVGKTLTAESVAEVMKVPLYMLSAGDLGSRPAQVEENLKDILRMVPKWGAVLVLDEADVFMETRNSTDLARNGLVSIFLRMLEYYEGILFLTSNRTEHIDPAFESRIHVSLRYPDLNTDSRRQIWAQFLSNAGFSNEELDKLAEETLNGRQIKNALKTAHLLASHQEATLNYGHVEMVLRLGASGTE